MNRRDALKGMGLGAAGTVAALAKPNDALAQTYANATRGLAPLKITKVRAIKTRPQSARLVVVKVEKASKLKRHVIGSNSHAGNHPNL